MTDIEVLQEAIWDFGVLLNHYVSGESGSGKDRIEALYQPTIDGLQRILDEKRKEV